MEGTSIEHILKCERCGALLAEAEGDRLQSHGFGIRIDRAAYSEGLAWAVCERCSHETAFDASWLKKMTNLAAHRGITMASQMFERPEQEPSNAELDAAVEASEEWRANVADFGVSGAEEFRELLRTEERLRRMKQFPERVLPIEIDGQPGFIVPLLNVQWDFDQFMTFANKVANTLIQHLESEAAPPPAASPG